MRIRKPKKLTTSLILFSTIVLVILNVLATAIVSYVSGAEMNDRQDNYLKQISEEAKSETRQLVDRYVAIGELLALNNDLEQGMDAATAVNTFNNSDKFNTVINLLKETKENNPDILNIGIGSLKEDGMYIDTGDKANLVLKDRPYYEVVNTKNYMVTDPYEDQNTGNMCVTIAFPISNNGQSVGILCIDLKIDSVSHFFKSLTFGETGNVLLLSRDNTIVAGGNDSQVGKNLADLGIIGDNLYQSLEQNKTDISRYVLDKHKRIAVTNYIEEYGWKLLVAMDVSEYDKDTVNTVIILITLLLATTLIVILFIRIFVVKKLKPISDINNALKEISNGNLHIKLHYNDENEIGEMINSLNNSVETLSTYVNAIDMGMKELSNGNLCVSSPIEFKGDFAPIQASIDTFVARLREVMRTIREASKQVSTGADQVSNGSQVLAQGATEQASSIEELAATIMDISQKVNSNTQTVVEASANATALNSEISESGQKMKQNLLVMNEIKTSSNEISKIIKTIEDIAFQTNILALNAAVEAARAGTAGKGFAVVADEVRNLAGKSAEASQITTTLIEKSLTAVEKGTTSVEQTAKFIENIVDEAAKITDVFDAIAKDSKEQAYSIEQVNLGIDQISGVVQTNSATVEQSAAVSQELSSQSHLLNRLLDRFKLPEDDELKQEFTENFDENNNSFNTQNSHVNYSNDKY